MNPYSNSLKKVLRGSLVCAAVSLLVSSVFAQEIDLKDLAGAGRRQDGSSASVGSGGSGYGLSSSTPSSSTHAPPTLAPGRAMFEALNETTYVVGPGDYFNVSIGKDQFFLMVSPEGYLLPEGMQAIPVNGTTLREAKNRIIKGYSATYRKNQIQVSLVQTKSFQVTVAGGVVKPGIYVLDEGVRLSTLLEMSGGFTSRATRSVILERASGEREMIELREYYTQNKLEKNPYLRQGDRVFATVLDASSRQVFIREEKGTRTLQFLENESLEDFIKRWDGFKDVRDWEFARVYNADGKYVANVPRASAGTYLMQPGYTVEMQEAKFMVFVGGMVVRPGFLDYSPNFTLMDYLSMAGIAVGTADVSRTYVLDTDGNRRKGNPFREPLRPGDHILVPRSLEYITRDYIGIFASISSLAVAAATFVVLTK